ncbi:MAG: NCS2 family permease [Firmicutes bacterium]|nr:NCS2 family permease [Bacillota bacterium]
MEGFWSFLDRRFGVTAKNSSVSTEIIAGVTTFMTMAYILFVNPNILGAAGMDKQAVLMATAIGAGVATIMMGVYAGLPFALAPGMGLNAYFAFTVVKGMGLSWQVALGAVFIDGIIFLILSLLPVREQIVKGIPMNIKLAVSVGIGLFIAFIGLAEAEIVVSNPATKVALGNVTSPGVLLTLFGLVLTALLMAKKVRGALLWGIVATTLTGIFIPDGKGAMLTKLPSQIIAPPSWDILSRTFGQMDIAGALGWGLISIVFTFTFVDMFDTVGTFIGLASKIGIIDESGSFPGAGKGLVTDAVGTVVGAAAGTSTVTTYVESAAGVAEGGKTGLTAVVTGVLFMLSLFIWPLAGVIPPQATAPALIIVGLLMMEPVLKIDLSDVTEALPAFLAIVMMPLTYSIANGLIWAILGYVVVKAISGRSREVSPVMWVLAALFVINFVVSAPH